MYTIREGIEKIRSLASAWLTDQTTDGGTAMGEVTATLLNTNFEEVQYVNVRQTSDEEILAEIEKLHAPFQDHTNIYNGITDPDVLVRLESRINAAEHPPGTWADNRQRMGSICTKTNTALSPLAIENGWASFSFKRDGWLAVEAVNALPELIETIRNLRARLEVPTDHGTMDGIATRQAVINVQHEQITELTAEVERLKGLLEGEREGARDIAVERAQEQAESRLTDAASDVLAERLRQVTAEVRTPVEDDQYTNGELSDAAGCYAMHANHTADDLKVDGTPSLWPWEGRWWKPTDRRRNLVKAGALILAEIERVDRAEEAKKPANWDRTKPEWSSHDWPQIFQTSNGNWFGVRAGWDLKAHTSSGWKGDEVSLLSDDGKFLKYGEPSADWRDSLEQRPVAELYTSDDEARMDVIGQNGNDGLHYGVSAGWIEWTGELCPVDDLDAMVWVRLDGIPEVRPGIARNWDWRTEPAMGRSRIVAYTLKDPAKAARP